VATANWSPPSVPDNDSEVAVLDSLVPKPYTVTPHRAPGRRHADQQYGILGEHAGPLPARRLSIALAPSACRVAWT
jgi:hypothetical protein